MTPNDPRVPGSSAAPMDPARFTYEHARHLLLRAGFGGSRSTVRGLEAVGLEAAVDQLVDYQGVSDPSPPHGVTPTPLLDRAQLAGLSEEQRRMKTMERARRDREKFQQLRAWWMERMLRSPRPLEEKMTLFLHGHFTSAYRDVQNAYHMALQNELLRKHATGDFARLVYTMSRDPAMLAYLDNDQNKRGAPNENYARELMELFTLGEGHYTETDVKEAARAFTGWTVAPATGRFRFVRRNHDHGPKVFLGQSGTFNADDIVRIILEQEAAPRHVASKVLAFLAIEPSAEEVEPYARLLRSNGYQLKPLLRTLFRSEWFYSEAVMARQVKSPVMLVLSTLKAMDMKEVAGEEMVRSAASIGQDLMQPPNAKGWDGGAAWVTSSNLIRRYNIVMRLISPPRPRAGRGQEAAATARPLRVTRRYSPYDAVREAGISSHADIVSLFETRFLATALVEGRRQILIEFLAGADQTPALDLEAPRQADNKLSGFLHLLATSPEFQLC